MMRFSFKKGLMFREGQRVWTLLRRLVTGKLQLEDEEGEIQNLDEAEVRRKWKDGKWVIEEESLGGANVFYLATPRDLSTYPENDQEIARYRHQYVSKLTDGCDEVSVIDLKARIPAVARDFADPNPPSAASVYRWWRRYRRTRSITALIDHRRNAGRKMTGGIAYALFEETLNEVYLNPQKRSPLDVYENLRAKVIRYNSDKPANQHVRPLSCATVYRWLNRLEQHIVDRARLGKYAADLKYRSVTGTLKVKHILARIEIDHTPLDLIVIDKETNLPLGRPWLTLAVDVFSRAIVGFYIGFHHPSSYSVMQCLKRCILPKDDLLKRFPDIKNPWPAHGIPVMVVCDNGADLHSEAFAKICQEMGIILMFCPAKEPWWKGTIERLMRTINHGLIHKIPGTVFSSVDQRGDYASEKLAAVTMETLTHLVTKWIVDVYHQTHHRTIGVTPYQKWAEGLASVVIELPAFPEQLDVLVGIPETRTLFHYGIEYDKLRYNSPQLQTLHMRRGETMQLQFKAYDEDVGYVHVFDPYNEVYFRVDAIDQEYAAGLPRVVHTMIRASLRRKGEDPEERDRLLEAKAEMQKTIEKATRAKRMADRKKAAAIANNNSEAVISGKEPSLENTMKQSRAQLNKRPERLDPGLDDELPEFHVERTKQKGARHGL